MELILDDELLDGPHVARIVYRPARVALPVRNTAEFEELIESECQFWGGGNTPLLPLTSHGKIQSDYVRILPGSEIDGVQGMKHFGLLHAGYDRLTEKTARSAYARQPAITLLKYGEQSSYKRLEIVEMERSDPWRLIYAACLGLLPKAIDPLVLHEMNFKEDLAFEDFLTVSRVSATGSVGDLIERLSNWEIYTPRTLSMTNLFYDNTGSTAIRRRSNILPQPYFNQFDAGPNVVVVCTPYDLSDHALLWNLRAAHGDHTLLPIGLPLAEFDIKHLDALARHPNLARNGFPEKSLYVTSVSHDSGALA